MFIRFRLIFLFKYKFVIYWTVKVCLHICEERNNPTNMNLELLSLMNIDPNSIPRREVKVLFVCIGNTCRSPMAEAILLHVADKFSSRPFARFNWRVCSAGLEGWNINELPEQRCLQVLEENRLESLHVGRQVNRNLGFCCQKILFFQ